MEFNEVGKIAQTHGLKGELKILSDSDFIEERFKEGNTLYIKEKDSYKEIVVKTHRSMHGYELVSFVGYDKIDDTLSLLGKTIYGERDKKLLKNNGHFYTEYIGLNVRQFNKIVGKVKEIVYLPHCDYLVVVNEKGLEKLVPIREEFIECVLDDEKEIVIVDMEGLLYD